MSKSTVTKLFVGSLIAILGGLVVLLAAVWIAFANSRLQVTTKLAPSPGTEAPDPRTAPTELPATTPVRPGTTSSARP